MGIKLQDSLAPCQKPAKVAESSTAQGVGPNAPPELELRKP